MADERKDNVVDFGAERVKHRAPDLHVECPRCGKTNFMRDGRCQHCGVWFQGEAFQFAPSEPRNDAKRAALKKLAWGILFILGATIVLLLLGLVVQRFA
jgi:predicted RNA-binding Zn-ribbon protein involved in translation (DUF1610 family)